MDSRLAGCLVWCIDDDPCISLATRLLLVSTSRNSMPSVCRFLCKRNSDYVSSDGL